MKIKMAGAAAERECLEHPRVRKLRKNRAKVGLFKRNFGFSPGREYSATGNAKLALIFLIWKIENNRETFGGSDPVLLHLFTFIRVPFCLRFQISPLGPSVQLLSVLYFGVQKTKNGLTFFPELKKVILWNLTQVFASVLRAHFTKFTIANLRVF